MSWFTTWFGIVGDVGGLHSFHYVVGNYGITIIMLIWCGCMFPQPKQALGAQKMQELQPELKHQRKFRAGGEDQGHAGLSSAQLQSVGGCLLAFVQLPILSYTVR